MVAFKPIDVCFGADPEFFFSKDGKVVGSELVLPKNDLGGMVCKDGVQAEFHPNPSFCRESLALSLQDSFSLLQSHLKSLGEKISVDFNTTIKMDRRKLNKLSSKARVLGCDPSLNLYTKKVSEIKVNPTTYTKRSAAGHIHLGLDGPIKDRHKPLVQLLDVLVGNTCVMLDRDPGSVARRKVYGKAGEYRLPKHGVEYRVPSNFWLKSYQYFSLVMGLSWQAVAVLNTSMCAKKVDLAAELLSKIKPKKIVQAINSNDYDLARENYETVVRPFLAEISHSEKGLRAEDLVTFDFFLDTLKEKGEDYFFPENPMEHWVELIGIITGCGWENFLHYIVGHSRERGWPLPSDWQLQQYGTLWRKEREALFTLKHVNVHI